MNKSVFLRTEKGFMDIFSQYDKILVLNGSGYNFDFVDRKEIYDETLDRKMLFFNSEIEKLSGFITENS